MVTLSTYLFVYNSFSPPNNLPDVSYLDYNFSGEETEAQGSMWLAQGDTARIQQSRDSNSSDLAPETTL